MGPLSPRSFLVVLLFAAASAVSLPPAQLSDLYAHYTAATFQPGGDATRWADASGSGRDAALSGAPVLNTDGAVRRPCPRRARAR